MVANGIGIMEHAHLTVRLMRWTSEGDLGDQREKVGFLGEPRSY